MYSDYRVKIILDADSSAFDGDVLMQITGDGGATTHEMVLPSNGVRFQTPGGADDAVVKGKDVGEPQSLQVRIVSRRGERGGSGRECGEGGGWQGR